MANSRKYTTLFNADSSGFKKGVSQMVQALEDANKALVKNQYQQKECSKSISAAQSEIKKLQQIEKEKGQLDEEQTKKLKQLNETIEKEKTTLAQLKTEQVGIKGTITSLSREITDNNSKWTTLKGTIANLASDGIEFLSRKLLELGKNVISIGEQFSASMSEVGAISGATAEQMELLEKTAREYGATTRFSASEAAQALKYMALAGWDANQSVESLGSVLDLAAAGNMDLAKASDIVTDYITAFGLSAKDSAHFADVMAYAMSHSNTNVEQLGEAYKNCAAGAGSMGYSVEDVTAALMTMANAGIKGGEAGTALNAVMTRLATDTKGCATELKQYGIEIYDQNDQMKSMASILESLSEQWSTLTDKQQSNIGKMIAGQNQINAFKTIMAGLSDKAKETGQSFSDYTAALEKCDGTSKGMAKTMSDNLSGDLKTMQSAFEELALKIYEDGETPLRNLVKTITNQGVPAIEKLIAVSDRLVPIVVAAGTAFVSYKAAMGITSAVNTLVQTMKALDAATQGAAAAQGTLNAVQAANPAGLVAAALGLLIGGLTSYALIVSNSAKATDEFNQAAERAETAVKGFDDAVQTRQDKYTNTVASAEKEAAVIERLAKRYDELKNQSERTTAQESEFKLIADELAEKLGTTAEKLNEKSGAWGNITEKVKEHTEALKQQAALEAQTELYGDAVKERTKAEIELGEASKALVEYYEAHKDRIDNAFKEGYRIDSNKEYQEYLRLSNAVDELSNRVEKSADFEKRAADAIDEATKAMSTSTSAAAGQAGELENAKEKFSELANEAHKLSEGEETLEEKLTNANKELENNKSALREAREKVRELEKELNNIDFNNVDLLDLYDTYKNKLDKAKNNVAELMTEQFRLQQSIAGIKEKIKEAADASEDLVKKSQNLKSSLSDLCSTYEKLSKGQALDLDTTLSLIEKYPEYSGMLLAAAGNADKQRKAIEKLFQAKKEEYILTQEKAIAELETSREVAKTEIENIYKRMQALKEFANVIQNFIGISVFSDQMQKQMNNALQKRLETLNKTIDESTSKIKVYKDNIALIQGANIGSYKVSSSTVSSSSKTGSTTATAENTEKNKLDAYLKLIDQKKALDELSLKSEIASYDYALKVFKATEEQKIDIAKRRYNAEKQLRQQNLTYAQAAYNKLINGKIKEYEDKSKQTQTIADEKIRQIDDAIKKRQQQQDDEKRKKEISDIDDELRYRRNYLTETERNSLLRRKQDILNEQANVNYERNIELKKAQLQEQANNQISKNTLAIERLNAALENAAYYFAKAAGNQTAAQVVNNSTSNQTINYLRQGTSEEEFRRLMKTVI